MALKIPKFFGVVCKKSNQNALLIIDQVRLKSHEMARRTSQDKTFIERVLSSLLGRGKPASTPFDFSEDDEGASWSIAMSPNDALSYAEFLSKHGLTEDIDFVITDMMGLLSGHTPIDWLIVEKTTMLIHPTEQNKNIA